MIYLELQDYDKAISEFNLAISINQNTVEAYNNRGLSYYRMKNYDKELADYNKTLEINPNYAYAYNNIGTIYFDKI